MTDFSNNKTSKFIFEPLNIEFDENFNPKEKNADYLLLREIFTDPEVMKTATAFACTVPENDRDLHIFINSFLEKDPEFQLEYGLKKIFSTELEEYIGAIGLIRCNKKIDGYENIVAEGARFLKSQYIGKGIGLILDGITEEKLERLNIIAVCTTWEGHTSSNHLLQKYGMKFAGQTIKIYKKLAVNINLYIKFPKSIKNYNHNIDVASFLISKKIT